MRTLSLLRSVLLPIALSIALTSASRVGAQAPSEVPAGEPPAEGAPLVPELTQPPPPPVSLQVASNLTERSAWFQLQALQLREAELWQERDQQSFAWPGVAVAFGIPTFAVLVPIGSILVADSSSGYCYNSSGFNESCGRDKHEFRVGTTLLVFGISALAATVWGVVRIRQLRKAQSRNDRELRTTSESRTLLENILGQRFGP
jgi:hypothetical protein